MPPPADPAARPRIRPAATLILLRDGAGGPETLMLRRSASAAFFAGAYVFAGGAVDVADGEPAALAHLAGLSAEDANATLGVGGDAQRYWMAAARECFEEAGILLARDDTGAFPDATTMARLAVDRTALNKGELAFADLLAREGLMVHARDFAYMDHWITPAGKPRRFDTRFFLAVAPAAQAGSSDEVEIVHSRWGRPADFLDDAKAGTIEIATATRVVLTELRDFATAAAAFDAIRARPAPEAKRPVVAQGVRGEVIFRGPEPEYAEVRWSDPDETTTTTYDLLPGAPKRLDRHVTRLIAPNPGVMTGPGTNTYLVGNDDELAVIDPGPDSAEHVEAIVAAGQGRIRWIFCTHTHRDHSPAARALQARTGARIVGAPAPQGMRQDESFRPDVVPQHDARYAVGGVTLRALHTPGHASNHFCWLLEETRMLFTGDHVMQGSTVIINPPDGDMRAYLASLDALVAVDPAILAPGHGYLIGKPRDEIARLIAHRARREAKVLDALRARSDATVEALVPLAYDDVPVERHRAAARSLLAHLHKLEQEGRVMRHDLHYRLA